MARWPVFAAARAGSALNRDRSVVVAVLGVRVMQVIADDVVDVVAVGNPLVAAAGAVPVRSVVAAALVICGAAGRVGVADVEDVLVDVVTMWVVQVPVVHVVDVTVVLYRRMAAVGTVLVGVVRVDRVLGVAHERDDRSAPAQAPSGCG